MTSLVVPPAGPVPHKLPDDAYRRMTLVLRVGLVGSLGILVVGLAVYLLTQPGATSTSALASNPIVQYLNVAGLAHGLATGSIEAYLTLGLLALVATPIVRVVSGFYYFRRGRESTMAAITLVVFVLLLVGLLVIGPLIR
jgi:uncharacterized membrane protein